MCLSPLTSGDAALDHDHKSGHVRNTIHKDCNILLGKIENYMNRYGKRFRDKETLHKFLINVSDYIFSDYSMNPIHSTHKTPKDKKIREYRRRLRAAKTAKTQQKYRELIKQEGKND